MLKIRKNVIKISLFITIISFLFAALFSNLNKRNVYADNEIIITPIVKTIDNTRNGTIEWKYGWCNNTPLYTGGGNGPSVIDPVGNAALAYNSVKDMDEWKNGDGIIYVRNGTDQNTSTLYILKKSNTDPYYTYISKPFSEIMDLVSGKYYVLGYTLNTIPVYENLEAVQNKIVFSNASILLGYECFQDHYEYITSFKLNSVQNTLKNDSDLNNTKELVGLQYKSLVDNQLHDIDTSTDLTNRYEIEYIVGKWEDLVPHNHTNDNLSFAKELKQDALTGSLQAGTYYINNDLTLNNDINITDAVSICLNGHKINWGKDKLHFYSNGSLSIYDCSGSEEEKHIGKDKDWTIKTSTPDGLDVIVNATKGADINVSVEVEVVVETNIVEAVEKKDLTVDYYNLTNDELKLKKNEKVGVVFDVKLKRTVNGVAEYIQPSDLTDVTSIKVKMEIPSTVDTSKVTRILHVHNAEDIDSIEFDSSKIKDGYYEIEVSKLSEFAFIYKGNTSNNDNCALHFIIMIVFALMLVSIFIVYLFISRKKKVFNCEVKDNDNKFVKWMKSTDFVVVKWFRELTKVRLIEFIILLISLVLWIVFLTINHCALCTILLIFYIIVWIILVILCFLRPLIIRLGNKVATKSNNPKIKEKIEAIQKASEAEEETYSLEDARLNLVSLTDTSKINKEKIANYISSLENTLVNRRENYVKGTKLSLADTHYVVKQIDKKVIKKCFIYVYELDDNKVHLLIKLNKDEVNKIIPNDVYVSKYPIGYKWCFVGISDKTTFEQVSKLIDKTIDACKNELDTNKKNKEI